MKLILSLVVVSIYFLLWSFIGTIFFGAEGLKIFSFIATILLVVTFLFGDKLILLLLGARGVTVKGNELASFLGHLSCIHQEKPLRVFRLRTEDYGVCLVKSMTSAHSLILPDKMLKKTFLNDRQRDVVKTLNFSRDKLSELSLNLCYQLLLPGYVLGLLSPLLKSIYFFLAYPIVLIKSKLCGVSTVQERLGSKRFKLKTNADSLVADIIGDYGVILEGRGNLWGSLSKLGHD